MYQGRIADDGPQLPQPSPAHELAGMVAQSRDAIDDIGKFVRRVTGVSRSGASPMMVAG